MSWTLAPAIKSLIAAANHAAPTRSKASDGTIGDQAHASRRSDHNPDSDNMVCAVDLTHDPAKGWDCHRRAATAMNDPRTKYVIWDGRIGYPGTGWKAYSGSNPHRHHMHVSVTQSGKRDGRVWFLDPPRVDPNDEGWSSMATRQEIKEALKEAFDEYRFKYGVPGQLGYLPDGDLNDVLGEIREDGKVIRQKLGA